LTTILVKSSNGAT